MQTQVIMFENIIIGLLFVAALIYVGNRLRRELNPKKSGCAKGCGCGNEVETGVSMK